MKTTWFKGRRFFSDRSLKRLTFQGKPVYKNDEIVFDRVRVLDRTGVLIGDMSTNEGIKLARSQGLDLNLLRFDVEPPTCVIADDAFIADLSRKFSPQILNNRDDFSFDPTARPATIQISINIADEEYERKLDLLRKHLLDRRRCRLVINEPEGDDRAGTRFLQMAERILGDVRDVAKLAHPPEELEELLSVRPLTLNIWPCDPEQTQPREFPLIEDFEQSESLDTDEKMENQDRKIRPRIDPRLSSGRRDIISDD